MATPRPAAAAAAALLCAFLATAGAQTGPLLVNCGSNSTVLASGRRWAGDGAASPGANFTLTSPGRAVASPAPPAGSVAFAPLYRAARVFNASSSYKFNLSSGGYYVRLHFHLLHLDSFDANQSVFDVTANDLKLFAKYNVSEEISCRNSYLQSLNVNATSVSLVKEYFLSIGPDGELQITFLPAPGCFAFVNAIEVIPVLDPSFFSSAIRVGSLDAGSALNFTDRGLETMYRLNVGGAEIDAAQDPRLWRRWEPDDVYIIVAGVDSVVSNKSNISYSDPADASIAPLSVYEDARITTNNDVVDKRFNMSWKFRVDLGFEYLVRLHFCELQYDGPSQRVFKIYVNFKTAAQNYDVFTRAGERMNKAYHDDFLDSISERTDLLLQLGPDSSGSISGTYAILNGLEIFKLSKNGNLAHASERIGIGGNEEAHGNRKNKSTFVVVGASVVSVFIFCVLCVFFVHFRSNKRNRPVKAIPSGWRPLVLHDITPSTTNARVTKSPSSAAVFMSSSRIGRRFTLAELRSATQNFDESLIIGTGGFGKVYKGKIEDGAMVAIKRANRQSQQGLAEFETEIDMLSKLRHRHLVSMIGYCDEQQEMILVYEYMANGTLRSHLFGSDLPPLSWKQRLDACIGAARGLHYLHTGAERGVIHRDVKTTNILLDENFVAKMADFGLSKTGPALDHTHVSTAVKGSFGYLDPEYFRRQRLTEKSDVYSFGVVLFEVICARPVINPTLPKDQINLAEWALHWQRQGALEVIVDPRMEGKYSLESLKKYGEIAAKCLADDSKNRPTMGDILWHLEYALQLHEAYTRCNEGSSAENPRLSDLPPGLPYIKEVDSCPESARAEERSILPKIWSDQVSEDGIEVEFSQIQIS